MLRILGPLLLAGAAHAGPIEELRDAENWFVYGEFGNVIDKLTPLEIGRAHV